MSVARPVRPAPEAPVMRCTNPPVRRPALAPALAPDRNAPPVARAAPPVRRIASDSRMYPVLLVTASAATWPLGTAPDSQRHERELVAVSPTRTRTREPDQACAEAVDLARDAVAAVAGAAGVGDHLGVQAEGERIVTHLFDCADPAYRGWRWAVTVVRAPRAKVVTVSETVLLPGPEALLAPDWVPWQDRLRPGDLGVGDLLPAPPDDERLVPLVVLEGDDAVVDWFSAEADEADRGPAEPGELPAPGRSRVLSATGRDFAAERWYDSEHGPRTPLAHAAPAHCVSCGFFVSLSGELGRVFGACANAYAPDDGRIVSVDHGCGAHSEAMADAVTARTVAPVIDEFGYDLVDLPGVSVEETVFEPLSRGAD